MKTFLVCEKVDRYRRKFVIRKIAVCELRSNIDSKIVELDSDGMRPVKRLLFNFKFISQGKESREGASPSNMLFERSL